MTEQSNLDKAINEAIATKKGEGDVTEFHGETLKLPTPIFVMTQPEGIKIVPKSTENPRHVRVENLVQMRASYEVKGGQLVPLTTVLAKADGTVEKDTNAFKTPEAIAEALEKKSHFLQVLQGECRYKALMGGEAINSDGKKVKVAPWDADLRQQCFPEGMKCLVYVDLDEKQIEALVHDHGATTPLSKGDTVRSFIKTSNMRNGTIGSKELPTHVWMASNYNLVREFLSAKGRSEAEVVFGSQGKSLIEKSDWMAKHAGEHRRNFGNLRTLNNYNAKFAVDDYCEKLDGRRYKANWSGGLLSKLAREAEAALKAGVLPLKHKAFMDLWNGAVADKIKKDAEKAEGTNKGEKGTLGREEMQVFANQLTGTPAQVFVKACLGNRALTADAVEMAKGFLTADEELSILTTMWGELKSLKTKNDFVSLFYSLKEAVITSRVEAVEEVEEVEETVE